MWEDHSRDKKARYTKEWRLEKKEKKVCLDMLVLVEIREIRRIGNGGVLLEAYRGDVSNILHERVGTPPE